MWRFISFPINEQSPFTNFLHCLWQDDDSDELDEEFEKLKNSNIKSRRLKVMEEIQLAEGALQDTKVALKKSEEQVRFIFIALFFHSFTSSWQLFKASMARPQIWHILNEIQIYSQCEKFSVKEMTTSTKSINDVQL